MENETFKIGEIRKFIEEFDVNGFGEKKVTIKAGTEHIIGADGFIHLMQGGKMIIMPRGMKENVKGYDSAGIAAWIMNRLSVWLPLDEMLEDYDITEEKFKEEIECALLDIGLG